MTVPQRGAFKYLVYLQLFSRLITFAFNNLIVRFVEPFVLGLAAVKMELILSTILFISREGIKISLSRYNYHRELESSKVKQLNSNRLQKFINLASMSIVLAIPISCCILWIYLGFISDEISDSPQMLTRYKQTVFLYILSCFFELSVESINMLTVSEGKFKERSLIEAACIIMKTFSILLATIFWFRNNGTEGILAFGIGQVVYSTSLFVCLLLYYLCSQHFKLIRSQCSLIPQISSKPFIDVISRDLALSFTQQSVMKHLLTQGDMMVMSFLAPLHNQGVYSIVNNYGSLVLRIIFNPLEESSRIMFCQKIGQYSTDEITFDKSELSDNFKLCSGYLKMAVKCNIYFALFISLICPFYTEILVSWFLGSRWVAIGTPFILSVYCAYVGLLALNGILEAFVYGVATKHQVNEISKILLKNSAVFLLLSAVMINMMDSLGLIFANSVNIIQRIKYSI